MNPTLILVGGPNGAGKTTFARQLLLGSLPGTFEFLNADNIAEAMCPSGPQRVALVAGKEFLRRFDQLVEARASFVVESTLSGIALAGRLQRARDLGYAVECVFLWLPGVELAIARVAERVRRGGHDVPVEVIRRRFPKAYPNFESTYRHAADRWILLDGGDTPPRLVARGSRSGWIELVDCDCWNAVNGLRPGEDGYVFEPSTPYPASKRRGFYLDDVDIALAGVAAYLDSQDAKTVVAQV